MVVTAARLLYVSYVVGGRVGMSETHCGDLELDPTPPHPYSLLIYTLAPPPQRTKTTRGLTPPPVTYDYAADVLQYAGLGSSAGPPMPLGSHLDARNDRSGVLLCRRVLEKAAPGPLQSHWALEVATRAAPRRSRTLEMAARGEPSGTQYDHAGWCQAPPGCTWLPQGHSLAAIVLLWAANGCFGP